MIQAAKDFGIVNKAEIDVFLELFFFFDDPVDVGNLISGSSAFSKTSLTSGSSWFKYCWSLAWRILIITLLACKMSAIMWWFEHSLALHLFWIRVKTHLFQSCGYFWVFQICWHIECSTSTASSFKIWNSSTGIPSPPLALLVVMLPKAYLTSHSRMSGSRWVITPSWLSGLWRSFLYSSSVYYCHLFLISSASVRSIPFLSFIEPIFACSLGISNFLEEISSLSHSVVFLYFFALITEEGFLMSPCSSLELCIQIGISFLFSFAFHFLPFTDIWKASSDSHFDFLHFCFLGMVLIPVSCTMSQTFVLSSSGTLSDLVP